MSSASALGEREYVVADAARNVIAVVRLVSGRPPGGVPHWLNGKDRKRRDCIVVVGPAGAPGLVIAPPKILVEANALIGMVARAGWGRVRLIFSDCTCGRLRRKCVCGARSGEVRLPVERDAWMVVDDEQQELGRITLRRSAMSREDTRAGGTRAMLARWGRVARTSFSREPIGCELVEAPPGFDWRRDGLFVALAVLCDNQAYRRAFPQAHGGWVMPRLVV